MKNKLIVLWIIFLFLFPACTCAEEHAEKQTIQPFVFRNGITWNSTKEQIIASDPAIPEEDTTDTWFALIYNFVPVSNFTANHLAYAFTGDQLLSIFYYFDSLHPSSQEYLISALESKYGTPISPDTEHLLQLINLIDSFDYTVSDVHNWHLEDGTCVAFLKTTEDDFSYLFYFNEAAMLETYGIFNTFGL